MGAQGAGEATPTNAVCGRDGGQAQPSSVSHTVHVIAIQKAERGVRDRTIRGQLNG